MVVACFKTLSQNLLEKLYKTMETKAMSMVVLAGVDEGVWEEGSEDIFGPTKNKKKKKVTGS